MFELGYLVERYFNKIKHCRRVATRYDKLATNSLAFVQLASIRLWLRVNESTSWRVDQLHAANPADVYRLFASNRGSGRNLTNEPQGTCEN